MKQIRTRFAPSPTGCLHIGSVRTALFSWLFARQNNGAFIVRIEDTDIARSTQASVNAILESLHWLQIDWDEEPYYQSKRMYRCQEAINQLLAKGHAYRCYCSKERLIALRNMQLKNKQKPRYDGFCRQKAPCDSRSVFVIRFRNPMEGTVVFDDMIHGTISIENHELDDLVIARSDGTPTYNLMVVIDDLDMKITHVIRGDDHINNTPRQINILQALGAELPHYGHIPMILGSNGKRLSKRQGDISVLQYRDEGYLPQALINYLVRLGWAHGDQEIFSRKAMIQLFNINAVSRSPAAFNLEKLLWLNQYYMKTISPSLIAEAFAAQLQKMGVCYKQGPALEQVITLQAERAKTLKEMAERSLYFYQDITSYEEKAARKQLKPSIVEPLRQVRDRLADLQNWKKEAIHEVMLEISTADQLKLSQLTQPIRVAVTANTVSPPLDATLHLIGREVVLKRLDGALNFIHHRIK